MREPKEYTEEEFYTLCADYLDGISVDFQIGDYYMLDGIKYEYIGVVPPYQKPEPPEHHWVFISPDKMQQERYNVLRD